MHLNILNLKFKDESRKRQTFLNFFSCGAVFIERKFANGSRNLCFAGFQHYPAAGGDSSVNIDVSHRYGHAQGRSERSGCDFADHSAAV